MIAHAPWVNFVIAITTVTTPVTTAPVALMARPTRHPVLLEPEVTHRHPRLRQRERREHADRVERDEVGDVGLEQDDETGGRGREQDDAVGEDEPVPALGELLGHEVVVGVEARQAGEVGEARVGGQHEDEHRGRLHQEERDVPGGAAPEDAVRDLRDDGLLVARDDLHLHRQPRDPDEHHAEARAHDHQRGPGVLPLRLLERRYAVGDRLDAGHRRTTGREGVEQQEDADRAGHADRRRDRRGSARARARRSPPCTRRRRSSRRC